MSCECGMCKHENRLDCRECDCCENLHANFSSKSIIKKDLLLD
jgi:hypothetical protein